MDAALAQRARLLLCHLAWHHHRQHFSFSKSGSLEPFQELFMERQLELGALIRTDLVRAIAGIIGSLCGLPWHFWRHLLGRASATAAGRLTQNAGRGKSLP